MVRFVQDAPDDGGDPAGPGWHGVIVHVQSNEEKAFVKIADALTFMARYVAIGDLPLRQQEQDS